MNCTDGMGNPCPEEATVRLIDPDGKPVPGSCMCQRHAQRCIDEYEEKLNETWTTEPLGHLRPVP